MKIKMHYFQYQQMRLPNLLEHETVNEVVHQSKDWEGLVKLSCHPDTQVSSYISKCNVALFQLFLCSLFAPICIPSMDKEILPCRSLCLAVKQVIILRLYYRSFRSYTLKIYSYCAVLVLAQNSRDLRRLLFY